MNKKWHSVSFWWRCADLEGVRLKFRPCDILGAVCRIYAIRVRSGITLTFHAEINFPRREI